MEENLLKWDGFNSAIIGIGERSGFPDVIVYDYYRMVGIYMEDKGASQEEAEDFVDINIVAHNIGERTPIIIKTGPEGIDHPEDTQLDINFEMEN